VTQASGTSGSGASGDGNVNPAAIGRLERYERRAETRRNKALAQLVRPAAARRDPKR
jgi:hypothetical protein